MQFKLFNPKSIGCYAFVMCMADEQNRPVVKHRGNQPGDLDYFMEAMHRDFNDIGLQMPRDHGDVLYTGDLGAYPNPQDFDMKVKEMLKKVKDRHGRQPDVVFFVMPRRGVPGLAPRLR